MAAKDNTKRRIIDFIEQEEKSGFFDDQIRKQLYNSGYDPAEIEEYLKTAHSEAQTAKQSSGDHNIARKAFMILLVISLVFNVILIATLQLTGGSDVQVQTAATTVNTLTTVDKYEALGLGDAEAREIRHCTNVNRMTCEGEILMEKALERNDRMLCEKIPKSQVKDECLQRYQAQLATINKDPNLCDQIPKKLVSGCRDHYFLTKSLEEDVDLCKQIINEKVKEECVLTLRNR